MKDVLVLVTPASDDALDDGVRYALALASAHGAHLCALIAEIEPYRHDRSAEPDNMQGHYIIIVSQSPTERLARTAELFQSAAKLADVPCEIHSSQSQSLSLRELLIDCVQVRDIVVLDVCGPLRHPRQGLVEGTLFRAGRSIILVPNGASPYTECRILVAWDATRAAVRALHDALPLLIRAREVIIVSVIDDKGFPTPRSGDQLCRYLARWNVDARFETIKRENLNVGSALLADTLRVKADLLVMGAFAHDREREFLLGGATRDIFLASLEIPVLLSH